MHLRVPSSPSLSSRGSFLRIAFLSRSSCFAFAALMRAVRLSTRMRHSASSSMLNFLLSSFFMLSTSLRATSPMPQAYSRRET